MAPFRWAQTANRGYFPNPQMPNSFIALAHDLGDKTNAKNKIHFFCLCFFLFAVAAIKYNKTKNT